MIVLEITESWNPLINKPTIAETILMHKLWDPDVIGIDPKQPPPDDWTESKRETE